MCRVIELFCEARGCGYTILRLSNLTEPTGHHKEGT